MDIASISAVVAAVGVVVGVIFAIIELRNLNKQRQTDTLLRLYSTFGSKEYLEAWEKIKTREFENYSDYVKKYGLSDYIQVSTLFEGVGILLDREYIDVRLADDLFSEPVKVAWKRMEPIVEGDRKQFNAPRIFEWFEYLYNALQRPEQALQARIQ